MTMEKSGFTFLAVLLVYFQLAPAGSETVWLEDVTTRFQTDKRTLAELDLPDHLTFHLRRGAEALTLNLERNYDINPNVDMYFVRKVKDGQFRHIKTRNLEKEDVAYYQNRDNGAFMTVRCVKRSSGACERHINGNIRIGDTIYELRPTESDVIPGNVFEVSGFLGRPYFLQDSIRRENSAVNKEVENVLRKKVEEGSIAPQRRLHGKSIMFSSQNLEVFNNREETSATIFSDTDDGEGKTRQFNRKYYVDVAVLVDTSIWDLYASRVRVANKMMKREKVKRKIREAYSHIMNGVNLLYQGIEDTGISIKIKLCAFIYFQCDAIFSRKYSNVDNVNGTTYIDAYKYIKDLSNWDNTSASDNRPLFDHAMLFTRHDLYQGSIANNTIGGISIDGGVCVKGERISIVQTNDNVRTVTAATHELGHNLGAVHDGEKEAHACDPKELFIMTPIIRLNRPGMSHTKNRWLFSTCSVDSFKKTLRDKECVRIKGKVFDKTEWDSYVAKQPGEVYSLNDQCYFINGPKSEHCGVKSEEICYLMQCTYPGRKECMPNYYYAATGTDCGNNKAQAKAYHTAMYEVAA